MDIVFVKENILKHYHFNLAFAEKLVEDIPQELMSKSGGTGLENHPSFTLGHLATASAMIVRTFGGKYEIPDEWNELFARKGPGDPRKPTEDVSLYPFKEILLEELKRQHKNVEVILQNTDEIFLSASYKWRFSNYFPTALDLVTFMCSNHESMHLSQLSAWRRAMGFPSALASL